VPCRIQRKNDHHTNKDELEHWAISPVGFGSGSQNDLVSLRSLGSRDCRVAPPKQTSIEVYPNSHFKLVATKIVCPARGGERQPLSYVPEADDLIATETPVVIAFVPMALLPL